MTVHSPTTGARNPASAVLLLVAAAAAFCLVLVSGQGLAAPVPRSAAGPSTWAPASRSTVVLNAREHMAHLELLRMRAERAREWSNPREHLGHRDLSR